MFLASRAWVPAIFGPQYSVQLFGNCPKRKHPCPSHDGLHSWLGRRTDPTEEEITRTAYQLAAQGLTGGWLAVTEEVYYEPTHRMTAVLVRSLSGGRDWRAAWAAFLARRAEAIRDPERLLRRRF